MRKAKQSWRVSPGGVSPTSHHHPQSTIPLYPLALALADHRWSIHNTWISFGIWLSISHLEDAFQRTFPLGDRTVQYFWYIYIYRIYISYMILKMSNSRKLLLSVWMLGTSWRCLPRSSSMALYWSHLINTISYIVTFSVLWTPFRPFLKSIPFPTEIYCKKQLLCLYKDMWF